MTKKFAEYSEMRFIELLKKKESKVLIFMNNGARIVGWIDNQDSSSILVKKERGGVLMIYKNSIDSICIHYDLNKSNEQ